MRLYLHQVLARRLFNMERETEAFRSVTSLWPTKIIENLNDFNLRSFPHETTFHSNFFSAKMAILLRGDRFNAINTRGQVYRNRNRNSIESNQLGTIELFNANGERRWPNWFGVKENGMAWNRTRRKASKHETLVWSIFPFSLSHSFLLWLTINTCCRKAAQQ